MPEAHYAVGQTFPIQFAWRLPGSEYLRAVFLAEVLDLVPAADKYIVRLNRLLAGREETADGSPKPETALSREYWRLVGKLIGRKITIAYEAGDGRALYLRLETLTGEHNFFTRYENAEVIARGLETRLKRSAGGENSPPEVGLE
jgi:hypothetical protein